MRQSTLRCRAVKFKTGGEIRVLKKKWNDTDTVVRQATERVLKAHTEGIAGYAIVVWGSDGEMTSSLGCGPRNRVPPILVPELVRNKLLAHKITDWTIDEINGD